MLSNRQNLNVQGPTDLQNNVYAENSQNDSEKNRGRLAQQAVESACEHQVLASESNQKQQNQLFVHDFIGLLIR